MKHMAAWVAAGIISVAIAWDAQGEVIVDGLDNPTCVTVGFGNKIFVGLMGDGQSETSGSIVEINQGKCQPFANGLRGPVELVAFRQWLIVADRDRICRIDARGKVDVIVQAEDFKTAGLNIRGMAVDPESGTIFVSHFADVAPKGAAVYRIRPQKKIDVLVDTQKCSFLNQPTGLVMDGASHVLIADQGSIIRIKLADGSAEKLADRLPGGRGLAWDWHGRLFMTDAVGALHVIRRAGGSPEPVASQEKRPAESICLAGTGKQILATSRKAGALLSLPISLPHHAVDETLLPVHFEVAFPDLQWAEWKGETDRGKPNPLRPIVLTHANDRSHRVFVATQQGVIHAFANDQKAKNSSIFLDIQGRVAYNDNQVEEGFLGLAFHPKYKENGEFFAFYTPRSAKLTNRLSRFRVRKDDPNRADPDSEEILMEFSKLFWNHNGGTVCFGPDGYLYVTHGDGGFGGDPRENGQNLQSLLGKILRIDIDRKENGKNYAIPKDNPFVDRANARPEIWAYGLRNVWRMAFDRTTGQLWAADVGQNLYEEIDLIQRGGNYGWNVREGFHPFGPKGTGPRPEFIEPIWEYHHEIGKSIIGGHVYRGFRIPELAGHYIYGDFVTGRIWGLKYDSARGEVVSNRPISDRGLPMFSFGEDESGEVYMLIPSLSGQGILWLVH